jgi:hypothetical protein
MARATCMKRYRPLEKFTCWCKCKVKIDVKETGCECAGWVGCTGNVKIVNEPPGSVKGKECHEHISDVTAQGLFHEGTALGLKFKTFMSTHFFTIHTFCIHTNMKELHFGAVLTDSYICIQISTSLLHTYWVVITYLKYKCKIWGFHSRDYVEWHLLGCYAMRLL